MAFATNELTGWKIVGSINSSELKDAALPIFKKTVQVIVVSLLAGTVFVFFILKSLIRPLKDLKEKAMTISKGDLTEKIDVNSNDEIG